MSYLRQVACALHELPRVRVHLWIHNAALSTRAQLCSAKLQARAAVDRYQNLIVRPNQISRPSLLNPSAATDRWVGGTDGHGASGRQVSQQSANRMVQSATLRPTPQSLQASSRCSPQSPRSQPSPPSAAISPHSFTWWRTAAEHTPPSDATLAAGGRGEGVDGPHVASDNPNRARAADPR